MPTMKYLDYDGLDYFWDKINAKKQDKLTAGSNITISGNTISATQPTVGNATLTIQKNGTNVQTFTANATSNKTANITVPTKTSELTNDSGYTTNTGTITQVKLDGANVATSGVANVQAIPTVIGSSSVGGSAGNITDLKRYGSVNYNGSIIGTNILNLSVNRFYHCYERGATVTCNYFSNPNDFCNGAYSRWDSAVNPSTAFATTPFVLEIKKTSSFEMTDVSRLLLIGHRLYGELMATKYKIEVAYAYSNNTYSWGTIIDYDGAAVDICQKFYGLYYSNHGTSANSWHSIFGIRLTISGSTSTIFKLADVQLICGRGTEQPYESIHALSDAGGTVYGNVDITGSLKHNGYTYTLPNKNGTVAMTSDIPSSITVDSALSTTSTNPVQNKVITTELNNKADTSDMSTALAAKQDRLTAGAHINITGSTIKAVDYVHSDDPVSTTAVTPVVTNNMIADGTITADKFATGATLKLTLSTSDIGEGAALAANTLYGVYS